MVAPGRDRPGCARPARRNPRPGRRRLDRRTSDRSRAKAAAEAIAAKVNEGMPHGRSGYARPVCRCPPRARSRHAACRLPIRQGAGPAAAADAVLARRRARPDGRRCRRAAAIYVVKVDKITPGNALLQPSLINQMQSELQEGVSDDYAPPVRRRARARI